jgi:putative ABC transport system permease protein
VLASPDLVIVPNGFLSTGIGRVGRSVKVGEVLTLIDPGTGHRHPLTVVGLGSDLDPAQNGAMVGAPALPTLVDRTSASRFYVEVAPGQSPDDVAQRLQGALIANGVEADTFRALVDDRLSGETQFIELLEGYLSLGLLIGIAGLGVVMVRAVRERRREIGMLRAMGFPARVVRRAFLVEATFIAGQGMVIGGGLGLAVGFAVLSNSSAFADQGLPFTVPWLVLALVAAGVLGLSLLAVTAPAAQASRIRPAVALRTAD